MTYYDDVVTFHRLWHEPPKVPEFPFKDPRTWARRVRLINEEWAETCIAYSEEDVCGFADGLVDLTWVVLGTAVEAGMPFDRLWAEVKRANMDKREGGLSPSGKLRKPPGWRPPDIASILLQGFEERR